MRNLVHASAVRAVFDLPLPVLHFVSDPRTLVRLRINFMELSFQFFPVNLEIIVRKVTTRNKITMCNCKIRTLTLALRQFCIHEVI